MDTIKTYPFFLVMALASGSCGQEAESQSETPNSNNSANNSTPTGTNNSTNNHTSSATNNLTSTATNNATTTKSSNNATTPQFHSLHVELVWDTPGDFNQDDTVGADMDLHLAHPEGSVGADRLDLDGDGIPEPWGSIRYDCYGRNPRPDWGFLFDATDDPTHDKDDINGLGPENIVLEQMEPVMYRVGAAYYSAATFGESTATVRIYVDDELRHAASIVLPNQGYLWEVAWVNGETGEVVSRDDLDGPLLFTPIP